MLKGHVSALDPLILLKRSLLLYAPSVQCGDDVRLEGCHTDLLIGLLLANRDAL